MRENAGTTLNLLEGCLEHGAGLVYPVDRPRGASSRRRTRTRSPSASARSPAASTPRRPTVVRLTSVFGPGQVAWEGATGAIAAFAARALAGEPIVIPGDPERTRDFVYVDDVVAALERIVAGGRWNETLTVASGVADAAAARGRARPRRRRQLASPIETPGGELPPGENESYGGRRAARFFRPAPRRSYSRLCRLAPSTRCSKPRLSADQIADRLDGGDWRGLELCLRRQARRRATTRSSEAIDASASRRSASRVTAESPVAWPSGAFVRVDRLDDEARAGIERSAALRRRDRLARPDHPPVRPAVARTSSAPPARSTRARSRSSCASTPTPARRAGVTPLIENVPPVLRMRTGGVFLSPVGGHWRDLLDWRERVPELGFTLDTSHAALFRSFAAAYPSLFGLASDEELELERYVEELGPAAEVAHVSDAHGLLGEGLPYGVRRARPRPGRAPARRARPVHRRRDQRARPRALART